MSRKPKFRPVITRVKLNPEQAVLACSCYSVGAVGNPAQPDWEPQQCCQAGTKNQSRAWNYIGATAGIS